MPSVCLYAAAKFKIADVLATGPKHVSELARANGANEGALHRALRLLASLGVFEETSPGTFVNTPLSSVIRGDFPDSARNTIMFMSNPLHVRVFAEFMHSIETGGTAFKKATGFESFQFFEKQDEEAAAFHASMTASSERFMQPAIDAYDFGETGTLADVGAGHGVVLAAILQKHRGLRGILFDLPHVAEGAKPRIESLGLAPRCEIVGGDFFEAVPPADSYVMKSVIHDWDDAHALAILKNCAKAMRDPKGKVIVLELIIAPGNGPGLGKWIDIEMLAMVGGRERTEAEFAELFARAGLRLTRVVRSPSIFCAIEAVKA